MKWEVMSFRDGSVEIGVPAARASDVVGATFRAAGETEPGMFIKSNGAIENEIPRLASLSASMVVPRSRPQHSLPTGRDGRRACGRLRLDRALSPPWHIGGIPWVPRLPLPRPVSR